METSESQTSIQDNAPQTSLKPPDKRRLLPWVLLALLLLGAGFGWRWWQTSHAQGQSAAGEGGPPPPRVKLATVRSGTVDTSSEYVADLDSPRSVTLRPQIEGRVSQIFAKEGEQIAAGRPILQVNPEEQAAAVNSVSAAAEAAQAEVENARATLASLEAERVSNLSDVQFNQREYERYASLAAQGAVARQLSDQYTNRIQTARASLAAINKQIQAQRATVARAEKAVRQAQANTQEQQVQLQYFKIAAPFAGIVGDIPVKVGDLVDASTQLATVTQNQFLDVNISVPIERAPELRVGMPVELMNPQGQRVGTSRIFFISPNVSNETQSVLIKSRFDNSQGKLRADSFVQARVIWNKRPGVLIPATAVTRLGGEAFVYVAQRKQSQQGQAQLIAQQKPIELGEIRGNNYQVTKGLQPGEEIITSGLLNLRNGVPIVPES
ncbi:MAG TPA: efflux RND transporter periplasmic adaptor subunit [Candidatus Caenarcaniphilales bacterium]